MTFLLICSSVTMVQGAGRDPGRRTASVPERCSLLTILGGITFLGMQAYEWTHLIHEGLALTHNPWGASQFGTTFFMTHRLPRLPRVRRRRLPELRPGQGTARQATRRTNYNGVETVGLYWHFVDLVWILVFTFVYLV